MDRFVRCEARQRGGESIRLIRRGDFVQMAQDVEQAAIEDVRGDPAELVAGFGDPRPLEALPAAGQPFLPAAGGGGHRLAVPICSAKRSSTSFACKAPMTSSSLPSMMLSRQ